MSFTMRAALVASGGAFGGVARVLLAQGTQASVDHFATPALTLLMVNLSGCLLAGFVRSMLERRSSQDRTIEAMDVFLITGFCGGYTSYSAFVGFFVEGLKHAPVTAMSIAIATVAFCPCATLLGMYFGGGYRARGRVATDSV